MIWRRVCSDSSLVLRTYLPVFFNLHSRVIVYTMPPETNKNVRARTMTSHPIPTAVACALAVILAASLAACDRGDASPRAAQASPAVAARVRLAAPQNVPIVLEAVGQ